MNITYELLINMVAVGKMTREQLIKKLGISRSTYYRMLNKFNEEKRQHLKAVLLKNQNSSIKEYYLDVSFREMYGEYTAARYFIGKGRVFETCPNPELINVQDISLKELYEESKENVIVVCSAISKAEIFKNAGFKNILLYQKQNAYYLLKGKRKAFV